MKTLMVRAAGDPVPMEKNPRRTIGAAGVSVPDNQYYRRRIRSGELVEVTS